MSLNRVFNNVFPELRQALAMMEEPLTVAARHHRGAFSPLVESFKSAYAPAIDLSETNSGYVVEAELPGVPKDKIDIEFDDNTLVLKSTFDSAHDTGKGVEKKEDQAIVQTDEKKYWTKERTFASFERRIQFPGRVDADNVKANYKDGVLTISIPKSESEKAKRISIDSDDN